MKFVNIVLASVLVFGLATSCGSNSNTKKEAANDTAQAAEDTGFVSIFDGKTTDGWIKYDSSAFPSKGWEVVDGTLHCIGSGNGEAGNGGDIIYNKKLKNFELELEWKISKGGNSGIFILAQQIPNEPIWKSGLEMQILDNANHPDAKLGKDGDRQAGSLYDLIPAKPQNAKPFGEWNSAKILCYEGTVVFTQNGVNVVEFHLWTPDWKTMVENSKFKDYKWFLDPAHEGYIGLQDHGDDVWFRNIKLKIM
ncbi:MAG TPA: DUF1080 domain-containing protein [Bacteroidales bacterium]|nr:DUF1080 domain-containing protein [Bacteroidales bacterium]